MRTRMRLASAALATLVCVGVASAQPPFPRGPGGGPGSPAAREDQALADLKLPGEQNVKAQRALDAQQEATQKALDRSRADLLNQMREVLTATQFRDFRDAVDRGRGNPQKSIQHLNRLFYSSTVDQKHLLRRGTRRSLSSSWR